MHLTHTVFLPLALLALIQCSFEGFNYIQKTLVVTLIPLAVAFTLACGYVVSTYWNRKPRPSSKELEAYMVPNELEGSLTDKQVKHKHVSWRSLLDPAVVL